MTSNEGEIKAKREAAARARRLLHEFTSAQDRARVLKFVAELEEQADALERLTQSPPAIMPQVTQVQMQAQQGPPANDDPDKDQDKE